MTLEPTAGRIPAIRDEQGLPVGVQLVGAHGADELLLSLGRSLAPDPPPPPARAS